MNSISGKGEKRRRKAAGALVALGACFLATGVLAYAQEHKVTDADVSATGGLKAVLEAAATGDTVTIDASVTSIDLNGINIVADGENVVLRGVTDTNYLTQIKTFVHGEMPLVNGMNADLSGTALKSRLNTLTGELIAAAPGTTIYNSDAVGSPHGTISAPNGGFSIKNLSVSGTTASVDANSGASVYMGLVGSSFERSEDLTIGNGMNSIENVAFMNNVAEGYNGAYVVGTTTFFTNLRYNSNGQSVGSKDEVLDLLQGNFFYGNKSITHENNLTAPNAGLRGTGGGLTAWLNITLADSNVFVENYVYGGHAFGGGAHINTLGTMAHSVFYNNMAEGWHNVQGGGLYVSEAAGFELIEDSLFVGNTAQVNTVGTHTGKTASGGGLAVRRGTSGDVVKTLFAFNEAISDSVGGTATGGGMAAGSISLSSIESSLFYGNAARYINTDDLTGKAFGGGLVFTPGAGDLTTDIIDTGFYDNTVETTSGIAGGGGFALGATGSGTGTITINFIATEDNATVFSGNTVDGVAEGIYVGALAATGTATRDVVFNIEAEAGGLVAFYDPIRVDMNNGKTFALNASGAGAFVWGGVNTMNADGGSTITFEADSDVVLAKNYHLHSEAGNDITVDLDGGAMLTLQLYGRSTKFAFFEGVTSFLNEGGAAIGTDYTIHRFEDFSDTWLIATDGDTLDVSGIDTFAPGESALSLFNQDGNTYATLNYRMDNSGFNQSSRNAWNSKPAFQEVVDSFDLEDQGEVFHAIAANPENFIPSSYLNYSFVALSANRIVAQQALRADTRSRAGGRAHADAGQIVSVQALASPSSDFDCAGGKFRVWAEYVGARIDQDSKGGYSGYDADLDGGLLGLSYDFSSQFTLGAYFSYSDGSADFDSVSADFDSDVFQGGIFAQFRSACSGWRATLDLSYTHLDNDTSRYAFGNYDASFDQDVYAAGLEIGYEFNPWCNGRLTPFAGLRYQHLEQDDIRESGNGPMAISMDSLDADSFASLLGISLAHDFVGESTVFTPSVHAAWRHEFGDTDVSSSYRFVGYNTVTRVDSMDQKRDALEIGAALSAVLVNKPDFSFGVNGGYNALIDADRVEHNFFAGIEMRF